MTAMIPDATIARARRVRIEDEIERRGIKLAGKIDRCGSCPLCGGTDRFSINTRKQVFTCRSCGAAGNVIALVQFLDGLDFRAAIEKLTGERAKQEARIAAPESKPEDDDREQKIAAALHLWNDGVEPRGTLVERYLASRRLELDGDVAGSVLRWHPGIGAMVALFRNVVSGAPQAISRTFLDHEARKLERRFLGPVGGAAIKLDADEDVLAGLYIGEGAETGMAARMLGLKPVWALGSAGAIASFPIVNGIECLTILKEHDDASERAVEACARRWHAAGREVIVNEPLGGKDLNDSLRRRA